MSQLQTLTYPVFTMQNYASLNNARYLNSAGETQHAQLNMTHQRGSHSLKYGWISELARLNSTNFFTPESMV